MITTVRCSKLARPMSCAGSLFFKDLPEDQPSDAAKEGTAAGEYLERLLTDQPIPTHARNGVPFDDDMRFHTVEVATTIKGQKHGQISCEQSIDWQTRSGIWIKGTYDVGYVTYDGPDMLCIDDLKYGWGIVEAKDNWQLLGYAIGEVIRIGRAFEKIRMRIIQPRPHHEEGPIREWVITYDQLLAYKEKIEVRMEQIAAGENSLVSGPQCKYCPAAAEACPAFNKAFYRGVEVAHSFLQDSISDSELAFQLDLIQRVSDLVKTKLSSLEMLAISRIKAGKIVPNWITKERLGDRSWKHGISPDVIKMLTGVDVVEKVMLSPAKAEKIGVKKELIASMVDRKFLGQKLERCDTTNLGNRIFGKPKGE